MIGEHEYPNFDPKLFRLTIKITVACCVAVLACTIAILVFADPSGTRCPGWSWTERGGGTPSIYGFVAVQAVWVLAICFLAIRWRSFAARALKDQRTAQQTLLSGNGNNGPTEYERYEAMLKLFVNAKQMTIMVVAGCVAFCSIPLLVIATKCF